MQRDKEALLDIAESIRKILSYTADVTLDDFLTDDEKQDAVLRRILIISNLGCHSKRLTCPDGIS